MSDGDIVHQRYEQARGGPSSEWRSAENIGAFAAGFLAAQYMGDEDESTNAVPVTPTTRTFGRRVARALYVSAWAYLLYFVVGTLLLVILTWIMYPPN